MTKYYIVIYVSFIWIVISVFSRWSISVCVIISFRSLYVVFLKSIGCNRPKKVYFGFIVQHMSYLYNRECLLTTEKCISAWYWHSRSSDCVSHQHIALWLIAACVTLCKVVRQADNLFFCFGAKSDKGFWTRDLGLAGSG